MPADKADLKRAYHESKLLNLRDRKDNESPSISDGVFFEETEPGYIPRNKWRKN